MFVDGDVYDVVCHFDVSRILETWKFRLMVFYFLERLERLEPWNLWNRFRLRISAALEPFERAAVAVTRVRDTCSCQRCAGK